MFSFYPSEGRDITDQREQVMDRLRAMTEVAKQSDIVLYHENERRIYGAKPDGVRDIFETISYEHLKGIFDPANFVIEGIAPYDDGWTQGLAELTHAFHIKDKDPDKPACVPAGEGAGQIEQILADLKTRNWSGVMTLEPHMRDAGQFAGFTGPELFGKAAGALKGLLEKVGLEYQTLS